MKDLFAIPEIETRTKEEISDYQDKRLAETLEYLQQHSPFYQRHFMQHNIDVKAIKTKADLRQIPPVTKTDIQQHNFDFLCCPKSDVRDYVTTSGTLGDPVIFAQTDADLERLAYNEAISLACAGGTASDTYQLMTTIDRRFMAGLAYFLGVRKLGCRIVRVGAGVPQLQLDSISSLQPDTLIAVPSFILKLTEHAKQIGFDLNSSTVQRIVCIGEPIRLPDFTYNALGKKITQEWNVKLYSTYASTEMATAFTECENGIGGHHHPELLITEFLDENNQPVAEGETGELTITTLGIEGMPLLRFKTGDLMKFHTEPCSCGRNTLRVGPLEGRKQQMIKYKGTSLYPPAIFEVLNNIEQVEDYVVEVALNEIYTDEIFIYIYSAYAQDDTLETFITDQFRARLRVKPTIKFISEIDLKKLKYPENNRKPVKFIDKRK